MPEEATTQTGETPQAGVTLQAPTTQAVNTTTPDPQAGEGQHSENISLEEAKKLRSEAKNLRQREKELATQLKAYQDAEQAARDAQLSETERLKKQHTDLQARYDNEVRQMQERVVRYEVEAQAHKLGIIDPEAAAKLLDWSELEYNDDGTPKNAEELLKKLLKNKPYLKAPDRAEPQPQSETPAQSAQPNGQRPPATPPNNPGRSQIVAPTSNPPGKRMTLQEYYASQRQQS